MWKFVFLYSLMINPRVQSREELRWKLCSIQNSVVYVLRCVACCVPEWICTVSALHRDAWGFTHHTMMHGDLHIAHQLGAIPVVSLASQLSKCFQSTHYLLLRK